MATDAASATKEHSAESKDQNEFQKKYEPLIQAFENNIGDKLPLASNRITADHWKPFCSQIEQSMASCYPIVHGSLLLLVHHFLLVKRAYGSEVEKKLYADMNVCEFMDRIASKRAVVFFQSWDTYLLRNGHNAAGEWELVGTDHESKDDDHEATKKYVHAVSKGKKPTLRDCLSYDELLISALCGISSWTHFINNGDRSNCGAMDEAVFGKNTQGVYMGLVGARFEKAQCMEYAQMLVTPRQNRVENGYGAYGEDDEKEKKEEEVATTMPRTLTVEQELDTNRFMQRVQSSVRASSATKNQCQPIWRCFEQWYGEECFPTHEQVQQQQQQQQQQENGDGGKYFQKTGMWSKSGGSTFLNIAMYEQRMRISLELFLFDSDYRAGQRKQATGCQQGAFVQIVGLGTGVWAWSKEFQDRCIVRVTKRILEQTKLAHIDAVYFSWMHSKCMQSATDDDVCMFDTDTDTDTGANHSNSNSKNKYVVRDADAHKISIEFGRRAPADDLTAPYEKCLICAMYAWDSNAFPGNEYYLGMLSASGDPAAASCSTISFVQNSEINKQYVNGANSNVYFYDPKTAQYSVHKLQNIPFANDKTFAAEQSKWQKQSLMSIPCKRNKFKITK